jgi:putative copper resistance protein D
LGFIRPLPLIVTWTLAAMLASAVFLWLGDGRPVPSPVGIPDPGLGTSWGLPLARTISDLAAILTIGLLLLGAILVPARDGVLAGARLTWTRAARWPAFVWVIAVFGQALFTLSNVLAEPLPGAADPTLLWSFLTQIDLGRALVVQAALAALVGVLAAYTRTTTGALECGLLALVALVPPVLTGHAGTSSDHTVAVSALMVHVISLSLWCGGLAALVLLGTADRRSYPVAVPRFSALALWCGVAVALSGGLSAWIRLAAPAQLFTTSYGAIILVKVLLLVVLSVFGVWYRRRIVANLSQDATKLTFLKVAAVDVVIMAVTVGVGVALSRTPPPNSGAVDPATLSPARSILGFDLPPAPDLQNLLWGQARIDGFWLTVVLLMAALYATGLRVMRRSGDSWPIGRSISWFIGVALLTLVTQSGFATYTHVMFSMHMYLHMLEAMVIPIFLVLGAPITLALRTLPRRPDERGPREVLLSLLGSKYVQFISYPVVATIIFVGSFYLLYFTPVFPWLVQSHWGHVLMSVHFLLSGYLFFWVLIGVDPSPHKPPYVVSMVIMLIVMPLHSFFNIALMMSTNVLAEDFYTVLQRPYATDLLADQHLGASAGWALAEIPMVIMMAVMFVQWMRSDAREARRSDRAQERAAATGIGYDELAEYNARLAKLAERDRANHS